MNRLLTAALLLPCTVLAEVEHQHGAHVHGLAQASLVVDGGSLALELTVPGMDLVGFEHAPRDDAQRARIAAALATLEASAQWLAFEPAGACEVTVAEAHTHGYKAADEDAPAAGDDGHDHAHEHGHGHGGQPADDNGDGHGHDHDKERDHADGHGEFHLQLRGSCSRSPSHALLSLDRHFDGLGTVRVELIAGDRQDRVELPGGRGRIDLR